MICLFTANVMHGTTIQRYLSPIWGGGEGEGRERERGGRRKEREGLAKNVAVCPPIIINN